MAKEAKDLVTTRRWIVCAIFVAAAAIGLCAQRGLHPQETIDGKTQPPVDEKTVTPKNWPQFRGGQAQTGQTEGHIGERLTFVWRFQTEAEIKSSPAIVDGRVYVGSSDDAVYALALETGALLWKTALDAEVEATPCVLKNTVYIGTLAGTLYALDANTGTLRWQYETEDKVAGGANWYRGTDNRLCLLVGSYDAFLHCVDAQTGKAVWTFETDSYVNGSPAVFGDRCAFGGCDAVVHILSVADGNKVGEVESGAYIAASAAIHAGHVYAGNYDGELIKAPLGGGEPVWRYAIDDGPFIGSPAITDELAVIGGADKKLHAVDLKTGKARWTFPVLDVIDSSPAVCGDKVVVGSDDGRLYLLDLASGKKLWSYEIGDAITSSPAVASGFVVVGCDDGYVYAFK